MWRGFDVHSLKALNDDKQLNILLIFINIKFYVKEINNKR